MKSHKVLAVLAGVAVAVTCQAAVSSYIGMVGAAVTGADAVAGASGVATNSAASAAAPAVEQPAGTNTVGALAARPLSADAPAKSDELVIETDESGRLIGEARPLGADPKPNGFAIRIR